MKKLFIYSILLLICSACSIRKKVKERKEMDMLTTIETSSLASSTSQSEQVKQENYTAVTLHFDTLVAAKPLLDALDISAQGVSFKGLHADSLPKIQSLTIKIASSEQVNSSHQQTDSLGLRQENTHAISTEITNTDLKAKGFVFPTLWAIVLGFGLFALLFLAGKFKLWR